MDFSESYPDSLSSVALAARSGNLEALRRLVGLGKSVETQDNRGWRPLHEAAFWNHGDCIEFLAQLDDIQMNAYTFEGQTPLWLAANHNSLQAAQKLLEGGGLINLPNNEDVTPLHCAASKGYDEMVKMLVENGANVNLPDYGLYTPLHEAAIQGHHLILDMLLHNGADVNVQDSHGRTPLFCGAQSHSCLVVGSLVERSTPSFINLKAHDGATAVMLAAQSGCLDCIKLLIEHGANPDIKANDGVMALHLAVIGDHKEVVEYLLEKTDHSFIEQSGAIHEHRHSQRSRTPVTWNPIPEPVNIFSLALSYDRLQLVDVLINGGLNPDHFPSPLNPINAGGETLQRNGFKWQTPLSLVLSHSPFSDASLAAVLSFLRFPCATTRMDPGFVPPLLALVAMANFQDENSYPLLVDALNSLNDFSALQISSEEKALLLILALNFNPRAFCHIVNFGYAIDYRFLEHFVPILSHSDFHRNIYTFFHSLHGAGFPVPSFDDGSNTLKHPQPTLKQLCRKTIHSVMVNNRISSPIPKLFLPLPEILIQYLCFNDLTL